MDYNYQESINECYIDILFLCQSIITIFENCFEKLIHTNKIDQSQLKQNINTLNRSTSDSNIKYSHMSTNNVDSWEMLQIRLV